MATPATGSTLSARPTADQSTAISGDQLAQLLIRTERLLARRLNTIVEQAGVTLDGWRVLSLLGDGTGHPMTEIARHTDLPPGTVTRIVDLLAESSLVYRRMDPHDRRRVLVQLSHRGRSLYLRVNSAVNDDLNLIIPPGGDRGDLASLLTRLADTLAPTTRAVAAA